MMWMFGEGGGNEEGSTYLMVSVPRMMIAFARRFSPLKPSLASQPASKTSSHKIPYFFCSRFFSICLISPYMCVFSSLWLGLCA